MPSNKPPKTVDEYIALAPSDVQSVLSQIREAARNAVPDCEECISYGMPALRKNKRTFFYFAAFKSHIGIYPPLADDEKLIQTLERHRGPKGNLKFPLSSPIPLPLIRRLAKALARQDSSDSKTKEPASR